MTMQEEDRAIKAGLLSYNMFKCTQNYVLSDYLSNFSLHNNRISIHQVNPF